MRFEPDAMESDNKLLYWVAAFVVLAGIVLVAISGHRGARVAPLGGEQSESAPVAAGNQAANFKLEALDGHTVSLESLRGKVIFLNVWATWCEPCREEMPALDRLQVKLGGERFQVLTLSVDQQGAPIARK